MPPKAKPSASSNVYAVLHSSGLDSIHATLSSANTRAEVVKTSDESSVSVETRVLQSGTVTIVEATKEKEKPVPKSKAKAPKSEVEPEEDEDEEEEEEIETKPIKANTAAKKTKPVSEQRAANAEKGTKNAGTDLPANVVALLSGSGDVFSDKRVVVTGVPPTLGRKNAETLVENYGGKLTKSLSKTTDYVVVGNDAGPKKLAQIEDLGVEVLDEDALIAMLESSSGGGGKRSADEEEEEEEVEEVKPAKKKTKRAKA